MGAVLIASEGKSHETNQKKWTKYLELQSKA